MAGNSFTLTNVGGPLSGLIKKIASMELEIVVLQSTHNKKNTSCCSWGGHVI